jgi:hypothetical protein
MRPLAAFYKRARSPQGGYVDIADWRDAREKGRSVSWWSAWPPAELYPSESAEIAGAGFFHSITYRATQAWFGDRVRFSRRDIVGVSRPARPRVRLHYLTRGHAGSTAYWKDGEGKQCLARVCRYLEGVADLGFWSGNKEVPDYS